VLTAILLYGSKARNDDEHLSDTDLLGVSRGGRIVKSYDNGGLSLHVYPKDWLFEQCSLGSLFMFHISLEAKPVYDPEGVLDEIRGRFVSKQSYTRDVEMGARMMLAASRVTANLFETKFRRRYFWGLRTALMSASAAFARPVFSASGLEKFCEIDGLALHIRMRNTAAIEECRVIGGQVIQFLNAVSGKVIGTFDGDPEENLRTLLRFGGLASVTAGEIIYGTGE
jgi:hypothetical protein